MSKTPNIYEEAFAKTEKTDAILVVQGKKLHVNKGFLSYHSDYFNTLFNSDFKEKSMTEIPINDVEFREFATVLSLVHPNSLKPNDQNVEKLLELSDRFLLPNAKRQLELFVMTTSINRSEKIRIADKYQLEDLLQHTLAAFTTQTAFDGYKNICISNNFSDYTRGQLFFRMLTVMRYS